MLPKAAVQLLSCVWQCLMRQSWKESLPYHTMPSTHVISSRRPSSRRTEKEITLQRNTEHPNIWENVRTVTSNGKICSVCRVCETLLPKSSSGCHKGTLGSHFPENRDDVDCVDKEATLHECGPPAQRHPLASFSTSTKEMPNHI